MKKKDIQIHGPRMLDGKLFLLGHCGQTLYVVSRVKFNDCWESTRTSTRRHKFKKNGVCKRTRSESPAALWNVVFAWTLWPNAIRGVTSGPADEIHGVLEIDTYMYAQTQVKKLAYETELIVQHYHVQPAQTQFQKKMA